MGWVNVNCDILFNICCCHLTKREFGLHDNVCLKDTAYQYKYAKYLSLIHLSVI